MRFRVFAFKGRFIECDTEASADDDACRVFSVHTAYFGCLIRKPLICSFLLRTEIELLLCQLSHCWPYY